MDETHSHSIRRPTKLGTLLLFLPIREPIHQKLHLDTISSQTPNFHNFIPLLNMKNIVLALTGAVTLFSFGVVAGKPSQVINCNGSNDNCDQPKGGKQWLQDKAKDNQLITDVSFNPLVSTSALGHLHFWTVLTARSYLHHRDHRHDSK